MWCQQLIYECSDLPDLHTTTKANGEERIDEHVEVFVYGSTGLESNWKTFPGEVEATIGVAYGSVRELESECSGFVAGIQYRQQELERAERSPSNI